MKKHVLLGVSGGIAVVKIPELISLLQKEHLDVSVIMTKGAIAMLNPEDLEKDKRVKVYSDLFKKPISTEKILKERKVEHTNLAGSAGVLIIAPATANVLAKLASGIADDYLTTTVLAVTCPIILCPSMNVHMWENPATQSNIKILQSRGYQIIPPDSGLLACGYEGQGRLADIAVIFNTVVGNLKKSTALEGKKVIVTSGTTIESIDEVRFIANKSSGKMGAALAESAFLRGAEVLLLRSKNSVKPRFNIQEKLFESVSDLEQLLQKNVPHTDICIHAAAVSDFKVKNSQIGKISSNTPIALQLIPQKKLLDLIKQLNSNVLLVGFKAEYFRHSGEEQRDDSRISQKLMSKVEESFKRSKAEYIVINDISRNDRGFEADTNEVWIVPKNEKVIHVPLDLKSIIAQKILDVIVRNL